MKKLIALVLALVCVLGLFGCNNRNNLDFSEIEWIDGLGFSNLSPGEEATNDAEVSINSSNESFIYIICWGAQDLTLEVGLRSADGTEYSVEHKGGSAMGTIDKLPSGTYCLFVKNSGDYSGLPSFENPEAYNVSFDATGCINYTIGE